MPVNLKPACAAGSYCPFHARSSREAAAAAASTSVHIFTLVLALPSFSLVRSLALHLGSLVFPSNMSGHSNGQTAPLLPAPLHHPVVIRHNGQPPTTNLCSSAASLPSPLHPSFYHFSFLFQFKIKQHALKKND